MKKGARSSSNTFEDGFFLSRVSRIDAPKGSVLQMLALLDNSHCRSLVNHRTISSLKAENFAELIGLLGCKENPFDSSHEHLKTWIVSRA